MHVDRSLFFPPAERQQSKTSFAKPAESATCKCMAVITHSLNLIASVHPSIYVVMMSGVCLWIHLAHQRTRGALQQQITDADETIATHEEIVSRLRREGVIARHENALLREFLSSHDAGRALSGLMRRYVLDSTTDFAAFIQLTADDSQLVASSGLDSESKSKLGIDQELKDRIAADRVITLEGRDLFESPILCGLSRGDRGKASRLVCFAAGTGRDLTGVFLTTAFPLNGVSFEKQTELTRRLLDCLGRNFAQSQRVSEQDDELQLAAEILSLSGIVDREFRTPVTMARHMLEQLLVRFDGYRATLFMLPNGLGQRPVCLAQVGEAPQATLTDMWRRIEERLARLGFQRRDAEMLDQTALVESQVDSLVTAALLIPLLHAGVPQAVVCVMWQHAKVLSRSEIRLADWCVESLGDSILRVTDVAKVHQDAKQDGLTQLANRREFDVQLARELKLAHTEFKSCGLLLLDLDHFKHVNDTYGHQAGDEVLRVVADVLRDQVKQVRDNDRILAARYGGEEMAVILPGFELPGAKRVAESIRVAIESTTISHQEQTIRITASIGLAISPQDGYSAPELLNCADRGLYNAKELGRNRVCVAGSLAEAY